MKARLFFENTFVKVDSEDKIKQAPVFDRVFTRLVVESKPLGKICPIYLDTNNKHYVLGVITHNNNGTTSFFPQLPGEIYFDHLTLQNLSKDNHHFTGISNGKRGKLLPLSAEHLTNGFHHVISIVLQKENLQQLTATTEYPDVDVESLELIKDGFFTNDEQVPITVMKLPDFEGSLIFQLFLIPKNIDPRTMVLYPKPITDIHKDNFKVEDCEGVQTVCSIIPHPKQDEYQLGIYCMGHKGMLPTSIAHAVSKEGFYSKVDFKLYS
jgi:hypothetical protein